MGCNGRWLAGTHHRRRRQWYVRDLSRLRPASASLSWTDRPTRPMGPGWYVRSIVCRLSVASSIHHRAYAVFWAIIYPSEMLIMFVHIYLLCIYIYVIFLANPLSRGLIKSGIARITTSYFICLILVSFLLGAISLSGYDM